MARSRPEFLVLAIDIGTSSTRTALFDNHGARVPETAAAQAYRVTYGDDGGAELCPADLLRALKRAQARTMAAYRRRSARYRLPIEAVAASALWHGLLGLDRRLDPLTPVFTWADSRSSTDAQQLREEFDEQTIQQRTGCMLRSTFWPAKLRWLKRTQPKLFPRVAHWVSPSDWLMQALFGELTCSASMASATGLYDLVTAKWDAELVKACDIDEKTLGPVRCRLDKRPRLASREVVVFSPIGDGAASNLGSGADQPSVAAINVGTSAAVRAIQNSDQARKRPIGPGLFSYVVDEKRVINGGATSNAGNLRQWCLRQLRLDADPGQLEPVLSRKAAAEDSLCILPFWVEERAPTWPEGQHGLISGLNQATTAGEIARSAATAVFYRLWQILQGLEGSVGRMRRIIVSGGILQSPASVALLADAIGRNIEKSLETEASMRGAAVYALNQLGIQLKAGRRGEIVKHDPKLARMHRARREQQIQLEKEFISRRFA
jgi:gluconokinase